VHHTSHLCKENLVGLGVPKAGAPYHGTIGTMVNMALCIMVGLPLLEQNSSINTVATGDQYHIITFPVINAITLSVGFLLHYR